ncbi:MAG: OsmC family protein [Lewinellaceae bacterium]|nr:OsmC family protein [Lewinellaceae bacterium]
MEPQKRVTFPNDKGQELSALVELPVNQKPHTCALFAHCFTCANDWNALQHIYWALNQAGIAVLRFDFSEKEYLPDLDDLIAAARFMETCYDAPSILIGHSKGGVAVIQAAAQLPGVKALATINAPLEPEHARLLQQIRKPYLLLQSPQDEEVDFARTLGVFQEAPNPKSFIALDGANHLLTRKEDAYYAGELIATWAKRYINLEKKKALKVEKEVAVRLGDTGYTTEVMVRHHSLTADEPEEKGGNDYGPSPYDLVSAGLGACTAMTLHMYARRKKWPLKDVTVHLSHFKDYAKDMEQTEENPTKIDHFERLIDIEGDLTEEQRLRLLEIANRCPVHRTLNSPVEIHSSLK